MSILPAVIFDLDGTLVDSEPLYYQAGRRTLERYGITGFTWEEHTEFIGIGTRETLETLRGRYGIDAPVEELLAVKNRHYLELAAATEAFPAMRALVERLSAAGHPLAVASGSSRSAIASALKATGLEALLPVQVSAEDVGRGKPEPDVFLAAARLLAVDPAECVVIEDAGPGVEAARRAGMRCIAVPYAAGPSPDGGAFASAGLLFPGGQPEFDARRAYEWITAGS
ncbi:MULTISPECIES: HAD family hydrolase [Streptomyces]|uniref:HAD superfamily hydrolase (TIGR01509 family) n=2 Tax=Streptomyces TaxID=1883 RepID=A0ABT9KVI8_9ACTN|nr:MULTISPECIES: HAD family phosphatase [Streptomyces]MCO8302680.1 HAD family phosphatase [Streptomyces sp. RKCA744]MDN3054503.1 HAD family phosphatase [Streptomyces sp. SRF1]MDP9611512.1 HAD superfamily hydrolase (TIGR01509 family) [Streptomyces demainii]GHJ25722.1 hydrolase [Streptomyces hygroscopicus]